MLLLELSTGCAIPHCHAMQETGTMDRPGHAQTIIPSRCRESVDAALAHRRVTQPRPFLRSPVCRPSSPIHVRQRPHAPAGMPCSPAYGRPFRHVYRCHLCDDVVARRFRGCMLYAPPSTHYRRSRNCLGCRPLMVPGRPALCVYHGFRSGSSAFLCVLFT
jgi:hypothetical protein